jgi:soluble lytic murein transglycosylase-like protein
MTRRSMPDDMAAVIRDRAALFGVPESIMRAVVWVESSARWRATRYEKHYRWFVGKPTGAERRGQATSWGAAQVMGAVAREHGFTGEFEELNGPAGIHYGCKHLASYHRRFKTWDAACRAYNTGRGRRTPAGDRYLKKIKKAFRR